MEPPFRKRAVQRAISCESGAPPRWRTAATVWQKASTFLGCGEKTLKTLGLPLTGPHMPQQLSQAPTRFEQQQQGKVSPGVAAEVDLAGGASVGGSRALPRENMHVNQT